MLIQQTQILINIDHFKVFLKTSHDRNPLHSDISYARRTFFGEIVFYGMGSVILALAIWAKGRSFRLLSIQGSFHRPLLVGNSYNVEITEEDSETCVKILDHGALMSRITWTAVLGNNINQQLNPSKLDFNPLLEALDHDKIQITPDYRKYTPNSTALIQLENLFGLSPNQIPKSQLTTLLWASYFVGMECPGRRALFADFAFVFLEDKQSHKFEVHKLKYQYHPVFDLIEISGVGTNLRSLKLHVYRMPKTVDYPISAVATSIGKSQRLKGKKIFISGAARGFGSVLAKALALQGATMLLNCRKKDEMVSQVEEIRSFGGICHLVEADLSLETSIDTLHKGVSRYERKLDWIVNNASPRIKSRKFIEQTTKHFLSFVDESLSISLNTCQSLLPILSEGGWVFGISSAYLDFPKQGFSHYLSSKSALEGLLLGLAQEYPKNNFALFRAPRMLTDQTNVVADLNPPISAMEVAKRFLIAFNQISTSSGNFHKLD